jgi:hypothetical protein
LLRGTTRTSSTIRSPSTTSAPITYTFLLDAGPLDVLNYWLSTPTHEAAFRAAGFREARWHRPRVSPEGRVVFGEGFWEAFLADPPVTFLECVR